MIPIKLPRSTITFPIRLFISVPPDATTDAINALINEINTLLNAIIVTGGAVDVAGTPTADQLAVWVDLNTIKGIDNLPINKLNFGTNASATTFWRGDGTWASISFPPPNLDVSGTPLLNELAMWVDSNTLKSVANLPVSNLAGGANAGSTTFWRGDGQWAAVPSLVDVSGTPTLNQLASWFDANTLQGISNIPIANIAGGVGAGPTTFLRGDNVWAVPPTGGGGTIDISGTPTAGQITLWTDADTVTGVSNLPVTSLDSGNNATSVSFWRGDAQWKQVAFSNLTGNIAVSQINSGTGATSSTYLRGDGVWATTPATSGVDVSGTPTLNQVVLWEDANTLKAVPNLPVTNLDSGTNASASTFWRGDGSWQTPAGSGNVSNSGTPTSGQVAQWTGATTLAGVSTINIVTQTTGNLPASRLNSGSGASATTFWRGDNTWAVPPSAGGNVANFGTPTSGQIAQWIDATTIQGVATINIATQTAGNLAPNRLNSGTSASATTFWCGDGTWKAPPSTGFDGVFTVAGLPAGVEGHTAFVTNGRKIGEGASAGTGVPVYYSLGTWRVFSTDAPVLA